MRPSFELLPDLPAFYKTHTMLFFSFCMHRWVWKSGRWKIENSRRRRRRSFQTTVFEYWKTPLTLSSFIIVLETKRITFFRENTHLQFCVGCIVNFSAIIRKSWALYVSLFWYRTTRRMSKAFCTSTSNLVSFFYTFFSFKNGLCRKISVFLHRTLNVKIGIHLGDFNGRRMCVRTEVLVSEVVVVVQFEDSRETHCQGYVLLMIWE